MICSTNCARTIACQSDLKALIAAKIVILKLCNPYSVSLESLNAARPRSQMANRIPRLSEIFLSRACHAQKLPASPNQFLLPETLHMISRGQESS